MSDLKEKELDVKKKLKYIAKNIEEELPDGFGFALLTFSFNQKPNESEMMYISNANREDIVKAMKEWIEKTKNSFGNDTNKF